MSAHPAAPHACCRRPLPPAPASAWNDGPVWRRAARNTLACLAGCSLGDGMPASPQDLLPHLEAFLGFARKRTGDPELAAEAVQEALARALARIGDVRDGERVLPWFWRILRNAIADLAGRRRRARPLAAEPEAAPAAERTAVCACLGPVLAGLPERQRLAIERVDLAGEEPAAVAAALGISPGNLKVLRHRARARLRAGLDAVCRACARHGCVDCACGVRSSG